MPIQRLDHAVLYVRDAQRSARFYQRVLGLVEAYTYGGGIVFLSAPGRGEVGQDLGLIGVGEQAQDSTAGRGSVGMYHLSWEVDTLAELERVTGLLRAEGALVGGSDHTTRKSVYAQDPDGIELSVSWVVPPHLLPAQWSPTVSPLDLEADKRTYGEHTVGGSAPLRAAGVPADPDETVS